MSTNTYSADNTVMDASHCGVSILHDAYGHNQATDNFMVSKGLNTTLLANSATCELKFY